MKKPFTATKRLATAKDVARRDEGKNTNTSLGLAVANRFAMEKTTIRCREEKTCLYPTFKSNKTS